MVNLNLTVPSRDEVQCLAQHFFQGVSLVIVELLWLFLVTEWEPFKWCRWPRGRGPERMWRHLLGQGSIPQEQLFPSYRVIHCFISDILMNFLWTFINFSWESVSSGLVFKMHVRWTCADSPLYTPMKGPKISISLHPSLLLLQKQIFEYILPMPLPEASKIYSDHASYKIGHRIPQKLKAERKWNRSINDKETVECVTLSRDFLKKHVLSRRL